jgi:pheromone alpha factor receptor
MGIHHGSGLGASLMFLVVLVLLTKADKRKAFIFNLNALCLLINIIRCLLLAMFLTSSLYHPYPELSGDYSRIKFGDQATNAATSILGLVLSLLVLLSLSVQVWIVSVTTAPYQRYILMGTTTTVACVAIGFRAAYVYYHVQGLFADVTPPLGLPGAMFTLQAVAIWLYSCIFAYKLGYAIIRRRRLNMPQFGPMQIVFIMGCQTMIIPGTCPIAAYMIEPH